MQKILSKDNMYATRGLYDDNINEIRTRMSTGVARHLLDPTSIKRYKQRVVTDPGTISKIGVSTIANIYPIDVSSEMQGLNIKATKYPASQLSLCEKKKCKMTHVKESDSERIWTRLENPASNIKGTGINRAAYLIEDPQDLCRWEYPGSMLESSRHIAKDAYVQNNPEFY